MKKLLVHEVLEVARKKRSKNEKIEYLRANKSGALWDVLKGTYDDRIEWLLPDEEDGPVPYTPNRPESIPSNFLKECANLKYMVKGTGYDNMSTIKRETMFIRLLESIDPSDAEMMINVIWKKPIPGITKNVAEEAFPHLFA